MPTETDALERLSSWFKENGWSVLQDKKNTFGNQLFHIKGESRKKPDLIAQIGYYVLAVEVKSGMHTRELGQYSDTKTYYENYNDGKTFYFEENNNLISISDFVIGTYFSPDGHLYYKEDLRKNSDKHFDAYKRKLNPKNEYTSTFELIRRGMWDHLDYDKYRIFSTGIGALLSTILDDDGQRPAIFSMQSHGTIPRKWWHTWKKF